MESTLHFVLPRRPTADQETCVAVARSLHPDWTVRIWHDWETEEDFFLRDYLPRAASGAQRADLIRLDAIYKYGGVYLDSDITLVRSLSPLLPMANFFCSEDGFVLSNGAFGAHARHPIVRQLIDELVEREPDWSRKPVETTGPVLFARVLHWAAGLHLVPRETFYPYGWSERPRCAPVTGYGVHAWQGSWLGRTSPLLRARETAASVARRGLSWSLGIARHCRARAFLHWYRAVGSGPYPHGADLIVKTSRGLLMSLPGSDLSVTPEIALNGSYEEPELRFIEKTLSGGDFFIDVGCNVGIFSLVAARRVGPFGRVWAIDANDRVLDHLRRSLVMNWLHDRVVVTHSAVGARTGEVELQCSPLFTGGGNIGLGADTAFRCTADLVGGLQTTRVPQCRLDDLFPFVQELKICKIDVEGFEHAVLEGAERLLGERAFHYLMLELLEEVSRDLYRRNVAAVERVVAAGYEAGVVSSNGNFHPLPTGTRGGRHHRNIVLRRR